MSSKYSQFSDTRKERLKAEVKQWRADQRAMGKVYYTGLLTPEERAAVSKLLKEMRQLGCNN